MSFDDERAHILSIAEWVQKKATQGYHAVDWPVEYGGLGLSRAHARALGRIERQFQSPGSHELVSASPSAWWRARSRVLGSDALKERFVADLRRADTLACQLFSEPGAGSDLAGLATRAVRDGDEWVINGQKVWSSGRGVQPVGRADRPHRSRCQEAAGPHGVHAAARCAGRRGASDQADEWRVVVLHVAGDERTHHICVVRSSLRTNQRRIGQAVNSGTFGPDLQRSYL